MSTSSKEFRYARANEVVEALRAMRGDAYGSGVLIASALASMQAVTCETFHGDEQPSAAMTKVHAAVHAYVDGISIELMRLLDSIGVVSRSGETSPTIHDFATDCKTIIEIASK